MKTPLIPMTVLSALLAVVLVSGCSGSTDQDWARKDAHRLCSEAIELFPGRPAPPCEALHMCMNEAQLAVEQRHKLLQMIRANQDCPDP